MHTIALQLAPILGAEKSKVPFYIAGGLLVAWALVLSLVIGARNKDFPATLSQQRGVIAVTAILVLAAVSMAVVTSGGAKSETTAGAAPQSTTETQSAPAETTSSQTTSASTTPTATTGTPAPPSSPAATTSLKLAANPEGQLSYDAKALSAKAGTVTITMTNMSPVEHDVAIAEGSKTLGATPVFSGGSKTVTVKLKPGKYTFFCTVPGHRQAGMEGTLTVS